MVIMTVTDLMLPGTDGIIKKIRETVGDGPVYLSIDVRLGAVALISLFMLIKCT
jgi:hypothetical protein